MPNKFDPKQGTDDRRRYPRINLRTPLSADTESGQRVRIVNISQGGIMAESPVFFAAGTRLTLAITGRTLTVSLPVRVVHSLVMTRNTVTVHMLNMVFVLPLDENDLELIRQWADRPDARN